MFVPKGMDKENVVHLHNRVLLSSKNNGVLKLADKWMKLEKIILSEESQTQQDKRGTFSLISGY